jgi:hypothetical protein
MYLETIHMYRMYRQCIVDVLRTWPKIHGQYTCDTCVSCRTIRRIHVEYVVTNVLLSIVGGIVMYPVPYTQYIVGYIRDTRDTHVSSRCLRRKYMRYVCIVHDTFRIHLRIHSRFRIHLQYKRNTCILCIVVYRDVYCTYYELNPGFICIADVSMCDTCIVHVLWCIVSDTSRYVAIRRIEGESTQIWGKRWPYPLTNPPPPTPPTHS